MNTKHPSLADVITAHLGPECGCSGPYESPTERAQHIADMWRYNRTITSSEQLDALPAGTVIRDHLSEFGCIFEKSADGEGEVPWWHDGEPHYDLTEINLPALLIHHPDWDTEPHTERR